MKCFVVSLSNMTDPELHGLTQSTWDPLFQIAGRHLFSYSPPFLFLISSSSPPGSHGTGARFGVVVSDRSFDGCILQTLPSETQPANLKEVSPVCGEERRLGQCSTCCR